MLNKNSLENNKIDLLVSAAKSVVGTVPIAGSLLSELVSNIIPNQRLDRLTKYVIVLDEKLSRMPIDKINEIIKNEDFIDLLEEGFVQAARAITVERRNYIASIVSNGITNETIKLNESKYFLKILSEINDIEIIWLRYFLVPTNGGDVAFRQKHKNVLEQLNSFVGADNETLTKVALQNSYKAHLERLELIENRVRIQNKSKLPEFDNFNGKPKKSYSRITTLGRVLLKQIDLIEDINQS